MTRRGGTKTCPKCCWTGHPQRRCMCTYAPAATWIDYAVVIWLFVAVGAVSTYIGWCM